MSSRRWKRTKVLAKFLKANKGKRSARKKKSFSLANAASSFDASRSDEENGEDMHIDAEDDGDEDDEGWYGAVDELETTNSSHKRHRSHADMHRKQLEAWENLMPGLLHHYTTSFVMPAGQLCMNCPNQAEFRCNDCSSLAFYCEKCCKSQHRYTDFLHYPEKWIDGRYVVAPLHHVTIPLTHECMTMYSEKITVISTRGISYSYTF